MRKRDELPAIELAYDFLLAGNEPEAARVLRMVLDWQRSPKPRLVGSERKAIIRRRLDGFAERQAARQARRQEAQAKFRSNPFPVDSVAARRFAEALQVSAASEAIQ